MLFRRKKTTETLENPSRRQLFRGKVRAKQEIRLPWVISEDVFISGCTQCSDCINACDSNIITKDENGFPKVDFSLGECTFCNDCINTCQQPLFSGSFTTTDEPQANNEISAFTYSNNNKAWPITVNINDSCLAKNNIYCQTCHDECETSVIKFNYLNSTIPVPSINASDCTQCGACVKSCPQDAISFVFDETLPAKS